MTLYDCSGMADALAAQPKRVRPLDVGSARLCAARTKGGQTLFMFSSKWAGLASRRYCGSTPGPHEAEPSPLCARSALTQRRSSGTRSAGGGRREGLARPGADGQLEVRAALEAQVADLRPSGPRCGCRSPAGARTASASRRRSARTGRRAPPAGCPGRPRRGRGRTTRRGPSPARRTARRAAAAGSPSGGRARRRAPARAHRRSRSTCRWRARPRRSRPPRRRVRTTSAAPSSFTESVRCCRRSSPCARHTARELGLVVVGRRAPEVEPRGAEPPDGDRARRGAALDAARAAARGSRSGPRPPRDRASSARTVSHASRVTSGSAGSSSSATAPAGSAPTRNSPDATATPSSSKPTRTAGRTGRGTRAGSRSGSARRRP